MGIMSSPWSIWRKESRFSLGLFSCDLVGFSFVVTRFLVWYTGVDVVVNVLGGLDEVVYAFTHWLSGGM